MELAERGDAVHLAGLVAEPGAAVVQPQHPPGRRAAGLHADHVANLDISLGRFGALDEKGRLAQNVLSVYYELDPALERVDTREVFRRIAELEGFTA